MKRYSFWMTGRPTTVYVSWYRNNLCADDVIYHMQRWGTCTFEDWDSHTHHQKTKQTATIKFNDYVDARRALSVRNVKIENEDEEMVPAKLSGQLSAETTFVA